MIGGKQTAGEWCDEDPADGAEAGPGAASAQQAETLRDEVVAAALSSWHPTDDSDESGSNASAPESAPAVGAGDVLPAYGAIAIAIVWMGATAWFLFGSGDVMATDALQSASFVVLALGPLVLLLIAYLMVGPTSRRSARHYAQMARTIRSESARLDEIMRVLTQRIEANSQALAQQLALLDAKGGETSGQIADINESMRENISALARHSLLLGAAATSAREEMKTLMTDLPDVERRMTELTAALRGTSQVAENGASGLETQVAALRRSATEANDAANGAVDRLAEQLERIGAATADAQRKLDDASRNMGQSVELILERAGEAIHDSRRGIDVQGSALIAMIEQSRNAFDRAGLETTQVLGQRFEELGAQVDRIAGQLALQEASATTVFAALENALAEAERRFAALNDGAAEKTADLAEAIVTLTDHVERVGQSLGGTASATDELIGRAEALRGAIEGCARDVNATLPLALAQLEEQLSHTQTLLRGTLPEADQLGRAAHEIAQNVGEAGEAIARHSNALAMLGQSASRQLDHVRSEADQLNELVSELDRMIGSMGAGSAAQLVDVLHRIRQAATEATERARATLGSVIPEAAAALASASAEAMDKAVSDRVRAQLEQLSVAAAQAVHAAQGASEKLGRQMLSIAESSNAIEARIAEAQAEAERTNEDQFARRVSLLIESLNSAAIDVTKILSNEVTDSAWAAYLRGDRGVFTRRAVRLLDASEARDIARHYEEEPEFREQVNRYIHDFEAMLRRVLATREGTPLSVTLLSSDMGKLYVALAQAIERLRT